MSIRTKPRARSLSVLLTFVAALHASAAAHSTEIEVPLEIPRLDALEASFETDRGETVELSLTLVLDDRGKLIRDGPCTLGAEQAVVSGTLKKKRTGPVTYRLRVRTPGRASLKLSGALDGASSIARLAYRGPAGRARDSEQSVALTLEAVSVTVDLAFESDCKRRLIGDAMITSALHAGRVETASIRGSLRAGKLSFALSGAPWKIQFKSEAGADGFLGTLKLRAPPVRTTLDDFALPEIDLTGSLPDVSESDPIYDRALAGEADVADWIMEGPGETEFADGWMRMRDPRREGHHVFWCPADFPASFFAEWELQNLDTRAGLLIVFFAATGRNGEDLFDPELPRRGGDFDNYIRGAIDNYHISYYANTPSVPDRPSSRLRRNRGFKLLATGDRGILADSEEIHRVRLIKEGARIRLFVDERQIIDCADSSGALGAGKIGFRQMQWSDFRYRNFRVWALDGE